MTGEGGPKYRIEMFFLGPREDSPGRGVVALGAAPFTNYFETSRIFFLSPSQSKPA